MYNFPQARRNKEFYALLRIVLEHSLSWEEAPGGMHVIGNEDLLVDEPHYVVFKLSEFRKHDGWLVHAQVERAPVEKVGE